MAEQLVTDDTQKEVLGGLSLVLAALANSFTNEYVKGAVILGVIIAWGYRAYIKKKQAEK